MVFSHEVVQRYRSLSTFHQKLMVTDKSAAVKQAIASTYAINIDTLKYLAGQAVVNVGGEYHKSVLLKTNYLVIVPVEFQAWEKGLAETGKIKKYMLRSSQGYGIKVMTEDEFTAVIG